MCGTRHKGIIKSLEPIENGKTKIVLQCESGELTTTLECIENLKKENK